MPKLTHSRLTDGQVERRHQPQTTLKAIGEVLPELKWNIKEIANHHFIRPTGHVNESFGYIMEWQEGHIPRRESGYFMELQGMVMEKQGLVPLTVPLRRDAFGAPLMRKLRFNTGDITVLRPVGYGFTTGILRLYDRRVTVLRPVGCVLTTGGLRLDDRWVAS